MSEVHEMAPGPLFIVSMWRGGSSLLHVLMNKHPQVALMFEADLLLLRPLFLKRDSSNDWRGRWEFWNQVFSRHGLDAGEFAEVPPEFKSVFEAVHRAYARRKGAVIWGDKSPNYHDQLLKMARVFPSAKFIIVWRDPIATIGATLRAAASGSRYFRKRGMPWRSLLGYGVFKRHCAELVASGAAVHQLRYEDLVSDTARVMKGVCEFLQIAYVDHLCTLEGADRSAVYTGRHHNLLKNDVIVSEPRENPLSPVLRRKAERYVKLWRQSDGDGLENAGRGESPSKVGMRFDQVRYRLYRLLDVLIRWGFCFLPIPLLRMYRRAKENSGHVEFGEAACEFSVTDRSHG
jgi:hypothetical protein